MALPSNYKFNYYDVRKLLDAYPGCQYYIVYGERSNGKTYSSLDYALENAGKKRREQFAYIRRYDEDIRKRNMSNLFAAHEKNKRVEKFFHDWQFIDFTSGEFRLARNTSGRKTTEFDKVPVGYAFSLNTWERTKGSSYPYITTIIFDEFLTRSNYLPNEFVAFQNLLSSLIRDRDDVTIIMLGNTVNKYCPYFGEMGLTHVAKQKQGTTDVYKYGESELRVAVSYAESGRKQGGKASDVYFAFDNPQLKMITTGAWEIAVYPRLPQKYEKKDIVVTFYIEFEREVVAGDIVCARNLAPFIFFYPKPNGIPKIRMDERIYSNKFEFSANRMMGITKQNDQLSKTIIKLIRENRTAYATNPTGEVVRNFLKWSTLQNVLA